MNSLRDRRAMNQLYDGDKKKSSKTLHHFMIKLTQILVLTCAAGLFYLTALYLVNSNSFADQHPWNHRQTAGAFFPGSGHDSALATGDQHRILLATHNRLSWYFPATDTLHVLHQGQVRHHVNYPQESSPKSACLQLSAEAATCFFPCLHCLRLPAQLLQAVLSRC